MAREGWTATGYGKPVADTKCRESQHDDSCIQEFRAVAAIAGIIAADREVVDENECCKLQRSYCYV